VSLYLQGEGQFGPKERMPKANTMKSINLEERYAEYTDLVSLYFSQFVFNIWWLPFTAMTMMFPTLSVV
jgi:hypothetical protein